MLRAVSKKSCRQHTKIISSTTTCLPFHNLSKLDKQDVLGNAEKSKDTLTFNVLLWIPTCGNTIVSRPVEIYVHQLCVDIRYHLENFISAVIEIDE